METVFQSCKSGGFCLFFQHPNQSCAATQELAAGRASHLPPHQLLTVPQRRTFSRGRSDLGVSPFSRPQKIVPLTPTASRMAFLPRLVSLHGKATFVPYRLLACLLATAKTIPHPKPHPKGKTGGGSNFPPPQTVRCSSCSVPAATCTATKPRSHVAGNASARQTHQRAPSGLRSRGGAASPASYWRLGRT